MRHPMGGGQETRSVQLNRSGVTERIRTVSWAVKTASSRRKTNLKRVKYMPLLEVPVLVALRTVAAGRRVRWIRIWQLMLGKARDPRCRLLSISLHVANLHVGQHWRGDPRSRWNTVMSSRFSYSSGAGQAAAPDWLPSPARNSDGKSCVFAFLV